MSQIREILDTLTEELIKEMLVESTGIDCMDSGEDSGRKWQQNQKVHPWSRPQNTIDLYGNQLEISRNIYHFMTENFEVALEEDKKFTKWSNKKKNRESSPGALQYDWHDRLEGLGFWSSGVCNSYNDIVVIDQTIQYVCYTKHDVNYCLVSVHQGADVRGGYGTPRVFRVVDEFLSLYSAYLGCSHCDVDFVYDPIESTCLSFDDEELQDYTLKLNEDGGLICPICNEGVIS